MTPNPQASKGQNRQTERQDANHFLGTEDTGKIHRAYAQVWRDRWRAQIQLKNKQVVITGN